MAIDGQVCFYGWPFANPVKLCWCIKDPVGPLGSTNQNWLCARLLPMAVSIYPVVCVHSCCLLGTQHYYLWPNGRKSQPLACPPTPNQLISDTCDITVIVKKLSQKPPVHEYCMAEMELGCVKPRNIVTSILIWLTWSHNSVVLKHG